MLIEINAAEVRVRIGQSGQEQTRAEQCVRANLSILSDQLAHTQADLIAVQSCKHGESRRGSLQTMIIEIEIEIDYDDDDYGKVWDCV